MKARNVPVMLFILGILFIGLYGFVLSIIAVLIKIAMLVVTWHRNPASKQTKKFNAALILCAIGIALAGVGVYGYSNWPGIFGVDHDSLNLITWGIIGGVPFAVGSLILLSLPTDNVLLKKQR